MQKKTEKRKLFLARQAFVSIVIFILLITSDIFKMYGDFRYAFYFLYFGLIIFSSFRIRHRYINAAKQFAVSPSNSSYFIQKEIIFSETGLALKDNLSDSTFRWKSFIKKYENEEYYFLFTSSIQALIIPKRITKTEAEKEVLHKLFLQHLSFDAEIGHLLKT